MALIGQGSSEFLEGARKLNTKAFNRYNNTALGEIGKRLREGVTEHVIRDRSGLEPFIGELSRRYRRYR